MTFIPSHDPMLWQSTAETMFNAACHLFSTFQDAHEQMFTSPDSINALDVNLLEPSLMLLGFAIENASKGILVSRNPEHVSDGRLSNELKTHKLIALVRKTGIELKHGFEEVLEVIWQCVEWRGRYPVPVKFTQTKTNYGIVIGVGIDGARIRWPIVDIACQIYHELHQMLESEIKRRWSENDY